MQLWEALRSSDQMPQSIVHLWNLTSSATTPSGFDLFESVLETGYHSLRFIAAAIGEYDAETPVRLLVVSNNLQDPESGDTAAPEKSVLLASCKSISQEYPNVTCQSIDLMLSETGTAPQTQRLIEQIIAEGQAASFGGAIAYRGNHRWVQSFEPFRLEAPADDLNMPGDDGVYLIINGLEGLGLAFAKYLAQKNSARLILVEAADPDNLLEADSRLFDLLKCDGDSFIQRRLPRLIKIMLKTGRLQRFAK
jgi:acyl transferase domain-containing protein